MNYRKVFTDITLTDSDECVLLVHAPHITITLPEPTKDMKYTILAKHSYFISVNSAIYWPEHLYIVEHSPTLYYVHSRAIALEPYYGAWNVRPAKYVDDRLALQRDQE